MTEQLIVAVARLEETIKSVQRHLNAAQEQADQAKQISVGARSELEELKYIINREVRADIKAIKQAVKENENFAEQWRRTKQTWIAIAGAMMGVLGLLQMPWAQPILAVLGVGQ